MFKKETYTKRTKQGLIYGLSRGGKEGKDAMDTIYRNYDYQAYLKLYRNEKNISTVESNDILHDAFLIFRDNVRNKKVNHEVNINTYITSIAKNLIQNEKRKKRNEAIVDENRNQYGVEDSVDQYFTRKEMKEKINLLMSKLKPRCQKVLKLWQQDYSYDEIAEIMELNNRQAAKKQKFNCFRKMMELIPSHPELKAFYHE